MYINTQSLTPTQVEDDFVKKTRTSIENPVIPESSECSEGQEAAHVSETDLDVFEMETLPYVESPTHPEPRGPISEPLQAQATEDKRRNENQPMVEEEKEEEEEDALQLVREIFFTR